MFKGNPRTPGSQSFENIRFMLNTGQMSSLRAAWDRPVNKLDNYATEINDKWIVSHLVSGLRHEINITISLGILSVEANGILVLAQNWPGSTRSNCRDDNQLEVDCFA